MGKQLTAEMILMRCKTDKLHTIKNLNLWGNELEDISILEQMPNVEILSLSLNKISSLTFFRNCQKLTELYLRKNNINDLGELRYLQHLSALKVLWLWDNPCSEHQLYRPYIIKNLPNLQKLDNTAITPEERDAAFKMDITEDQIYATGTPIPMDKPTDEELKFQ